MKNSANLNKIKVKPNEHVKDIGSNMHKSTYSEGITQQSAIASIKASNTSNFKNIFNDTKGIQQLNYRISADFDKIDKIDNIYLYMKIDVQCNYHLSTDGNYYIDPAVLPNSEWLLDKVEFSASSSIFDIQEAENIFVYNCYKPNDELLLEQLSRGVNENYLEFNNNINSIVYPSNTTYVPSAVAPSVQQCTQSIERMVRLCPNLLNKILLKACNDEINVKVYFQYLKVIQPGTTEPRIGNLTLTKTNLYMTGMKYSPMELQKQLFEKYHAKEYIFTALTRKYQSVNFNNVQHDLEYTADIGTFAGTYSTMVCYLNYIDPIGEQFNQNSIAKNPITYNTITDVSKGLVLGEPNYNDYRVTKVANTSGLSYIRNESGTYYNNTGVGSNNINPNYSATHEIFEMTITLEDGNGDAYPYIREISPQVMQNFSAMNNNSDFIKSFSIYPFNFGDETQQDYDEQTVNSGHYTFDNSSVLKFIPLSSNVPSDVQLIMCGTQISQCSIKEGRIYFRNV